MVCKCYKNLKKKFYQTCNMSLLVELSKLAYEEASYLECLFFSEMYMLKDSTVVYYILSLEALGYRKEAVRITRIYKEKLTVMHDRVNLKKNINLCYMLLSDNCSENSNVNYLDFCADNTNMEYLNHFYEKMKLNVVNRDINFVLNDFIDNKYSIVTYKSDKMISMHIIKYKKNVLIIDCGAAINNDGTIENIDVEQFFFQNDINILEIQGVLITHAHYDHYGSIDALMKYEIPIYMTYDTCELIKLSNPYINLKNVIIIANKEEIILGKFNIKAFCNGHIIGSVGFVINRYEDAIFITGDYCLNDQFTVKGLNLNWLNNIKYLITETTNGNRPFALTYKDRVKSIISIIENSLENRIQVIIPVFSIGRAQEIIKVIEPLTKEYKVLIDGFAADITKFYMNSINFTVDKNIDIGTDTNIELNLRYYDIIISSSGMLSLGSKSQRYINRIVNNHLNDKYTIIKVGYIPGDNNEYEKLKFSSGININLFDISMTAHATYNQLLYTINRIKPEVVVQVHGKGINLQ